jgi:hypothetical protein
MGRIPDAGGVRHRKAFIVTTTKIAQLPGQTG